MALLVLEVKGSRLATGGRTATLAEESGESVDGHANAALTTDLVWKPAAAQISLLGHVNTTEAKVMAALGIVPGEICPTWRGQGGKTHPLAVDREVVGLGCALGCHCDWNKQCYKRNVLLGEGQSMDVGTCELSILALVTSAMLLFMVALSLVVLLRAVLLCSAQKDTATGASQVHANENLLKGRNLTAHPVPKLNLDSVQRLSFAAGVEARDTNDNDQSDRRTDPDFEDTLAELTPGREGPHLSPRVSFPAAPREVLDSEHTLAQGAIVSHASPPVASSR